MNLKVTKMATYRFCFIVMMLVVPACGDSGPDLIPVTGTVTLDGQPLGFKNLYFSPEPGTPGLGAGGNSKADGSFELLAVVGGAVRDMKGAQLGEYKVVVSEPMFPIDADLAVQGESSEPEVALGLPQPLPRNTKGVIPAVYSNQETTPLRAQVVPGTNNLKLELVSRP